MQEIRGLITACDEAIRREDFDGLMAHYTEDAVLVVKGDMIARGQAEIKAAFIKIAAYFQNSLTPTQGEMVFLAAGNTVLVLSQTFLASAKDEQTYSMDRCATYVFRREADGHWRCAIDHSYGTDLIGMGA
ncbi:MAG: SgcJ/EcaC family oxidoreductase [Neisseriaceae bacterium]|nr:SgcJ/EcaC family oxidoreductase [Neisseriaceae bacterium]